MTEEQPLRRERLGNGLVLEFFDRSNRYFGDYYRVRIEVRTRIPIHADLVRHEVDAAGLLDRARKLFGEELVEVRHLERMGVAGAEVEAVHRELIEGFLRVGTIYLQRADYPQRLLHERLAASGRRSHSRLTPL